MARQAATVVQNSFIKGLITENTALNFPEDACTEAVNCVFDETGRITRRGGLDLEEGFTVLDNSGNVDGAAFSEYIWDQVAGLGTITYLVQQEGSNLKFFDISNGTTVSAQGLIATIALTDYLATSTPYTPSNFACQYAKGNGDLIITNPACDPIYITYSVDTLMISATRITIKYRDFVGIAYTDVTYTDFYRPVFADINAMKTDASSGNNGARHFYNLLNQGWWQGDVSGGNPASTSALGQWDTARTDMPSNSDRVESYRASFTDAFDNARVGSFDQGNTPAAKGHFILDLGNADRQAALTAGGYALSFSNEVDSFVPYSTGTTFGDMSSENNAFNGSSSSGGYAYKYSSTGSDSTGSYSITTTSTMYVGKDYGSSPIRVKSVAANTSMTQDNSGFISATSGSKILHENVCSFTVRLYASNSAPSNGTDGTLLGSTTRTGAGYSTWTSEPDFPKHYLVDATGIAQGTVSINSNNTVTAYRYVWLYISSSSKVSATTTNYGGTINSRSLSKIHEVTFTKRTTVSGSANLPAADVTVERPMCVEWFASRAWYAGVAANGLSNNLYFSQIIEKPEQYGRCYQINDPTAESLRDILPTDGGIIKIPEIGKISRLFAYQTALIVFASNGVWIIRGEGGVFTPTNFSVRKISSLGTQSPQSFIDVRGIPCWWGEDGILQIDYNPQFDSYSVNNLTDETIRRFFLAIPPGQRNLTRGAYDSRENIAYWLYNDDPDEDETDTNGYSYRKVLCLNMLSGAFYPLEFYDAETIAVKGIVFAVDSVGTSDPKIKFTTSVKLGTDTSRLYYCDLKDDEYIDYGTFATETGNANDTGSYESSFITGYKTDGELLRFVQPNYVMVFLEQQEGASCYMRGIFDFTSNGTSGKWGSFQQIYNNTLENRNINYKRLKVRGKGRSVQFQFRSDEDAPFTIIGWGAFETANSEV